MTDQSINVETTKEPRVTLTLPASTLSFMLGLMDAEHAARETGTHRNTRERILVSALIGADADISVDTALRQARVFMASIDTIAQALEDVGY